MSFRTRAIGILTGVFFLIVLAFHQQAEHLTQAVIWTATKTESDFNGDVNVDGRVQGTVPDFLTIGVAQTPSVSRDDMAAKCPGYKVTHVKETARGVTAQLVLAGERCNAYGNDHESLVLTVEYQTAEKIRMKIVDSKGQNFDLSQRPDIYDGQIYRNSEYVPDNSYKFEYNSAPFEFWITRLEDNEVLFDTRGSALVFEDQYLQLTTKKVPDANIYGLGDTIHALRLDDGYTGTLYAADLGDWVDANLYGSHPFYMEHRYHQSGARAYSTHGVLLMTSNNMDVLIRSDYLQYRVTGGIIDLYVFTGPSPLAVVEQYVQSIGLPAMQSYWTLGYHQCRWGYTSTADTKEVVDKYREADIPLETIWNDIDYMQQYRDWTLDPNYLDLGNLVDTLHASHQHYIPIVDAAIYAANPDNRTEDDYHPYYSGLERDTFVRNPDGSIYYGAVWPGYTTFPDWLAANTTQWWHESLINFSTTCTSFDGIWLDMNEVSSFCVGSCGSGRLQDNQVHPPFALPGETMTTKRSLLGRVDHAVEQVPLEQSDPNNEQSPQLVLNSETVSAHVNRAAIPKQKFEVNYPRYAINNHQGNADLASHAMSPNATHQDGTLEYDIHNLFGWGETVATYSALQDIRPGERPFIISRSTFPGSGTMAGHWGGDNYSKWIYMYYSIAQALIFQVFGIPMVGPDTCGFAGDTDEELCSRWMQLSAFFPFYRNHNTLNAHPQEAYVWPSVASATRTAMHIRYLLLPYWYTLFERAHTHGTPVIRAMMMEFADEELFAGSDRQFMVGSAIMVVPVLEQGVDYTQAIFPGIGAGERWYDWYSRRPVNAKARENVTIDAPLGHIPVYVRGGHVLPLQTPGYTTTESRQNDWRLLIALNHTGTAQGTLYQDDGISENPQETTRVTFRVENGVLTTKQSGNYYILQPLSNVTVMGLADKPKKVMFQDQILHTRSWTYDGEARALEIVDLQRHTSTCGAFSASDCDKTDMKTGKHYSSGWRISWS